MNDIDLYCFSGTGNTYLLVKKMQETFRSLKINCQVTHISDNMSGEFDISHTLGLAFPIAFFSTYTVVWDFINSLPESQTGTKAFLLTSFGGQDGGISSQIAAALQAKGYEMIGYCGVVMPGNFLNKSLDAQKNNKLIANGEHKAEKFARQLAAGEVEFKPANRLYGMLGYATYTIFLKSRLFSKIAKIKVNKEKCTGCGICAELCPVKNISMVEGTPQFGNNCQECMRCLGYCPSGALKLFNAVPYKACSCEEFKKEVTE